MSYRNMLVLTLVLALAVFPAIALAQEAINVTHTVDCGDVDFVVPDPGGTAPYNLSWDFDGDEEVDSTEADVESFPHTTTHTYPGPGDYAWFLSVNDSGDPANEFTASGLVEVEGFTVSLSADDTRPVLEAGEADVEFTATVDGPEGRSYTYEWDFGDATADVTNGPEASHTYTSGGRFDATVTVTDNCGFEESATVTIFVVDPSCHPMAQRIAEAVSLLYPDQAQQTYTCEDIVAIWRGVFTGDFFENLVAGMQVGLGRMWHAYQLTQVIEDLYWEEILDWHLGNSGWGLLLQLDKFADALEDLDIRDLMALVEEGVKVQDIRHAVRMVTRFDADFEDALARLEESSPGQVGQFYALVQELGVDPEVLDGYLADGASLADIRHASKSFGEDWEAALAAKLAGNSWGDINQAYRLAGEDGDPQAILELGVQEYRRQQREEAQTERQSDRNGSTAARLARQYGVSVEQVWATYEGCGGDWQCVRNYYRQQAGGNRGRGPH